jgi:hypothetical protein
MQVHRCPYTVGGWESPHAPTGRGTATARESKEVRDEPAYAREVEVSCSCGTVTGVALNTADMVAGTTAEVAVTCGGCLAPHWLTVRRRLAQVGRGR